MKNHYLYSSSMFVGFLSFRPKQTRLISKMPALRSQRCSMASSSSPSNELCPLWSGYTLTGGLKYYWMLGRLKQLFECCVDVHASVLVTW